ncbi:hypothetical protein KSS87_021353 [Heliosperma pusillum]|nr:hypothetical protein KSS87_021353 [Heliosperma pusillum]
MIEIIWLKTGDTQPKKASLLVIAHPDDESMFFTPTINYLTSRGHDIHILCLSTGNADGMGNIRKDELYKACGTLKVPLTQVTILDHPELQDGFGKVWNHTLIAKLVGDSIKSQGIDTVITFDSFGVSGHCNHRDVNYGARKLLLDYPQNSIEAWELMSTNMLRKYSGPLDIWMSSYMAWHHSNTKPFCLINEHPIRSFCAMAQHKSQWVCKTDMGPALFGRQMISWDGRVTAIAITYLQGDLNNPQAGTVRFDCPDDVYIPGPGGGARH